jgi:hypothetical protein
MGRFLLCLAHKAIALTSHCPARLWAGSGRWLRGPRTPDLLALACSHLGPLGCGPRAQSLFSAHRFDHAFPSHRRMGSGTSTAGCGPNSSAGPPTTIDLPGSARNNFSALRVARRGEMGEVASPTNTAIRGSLPQYQCTYLALAIPLS